MKVCGFTIVKNAVKFEYQLQEAICSVLPLVDKFIVNLGDSDDGTEEIIKNINSDKIEIYHSTWDHTNKNGHFLSVETNKVFDEVPEEYDWCIYVQSDEVLHEKDYTEIESAMHKYKDNKDVNGLIFNWHHFWGNYNYTSFGRCWYRSDIRIIKNDKNIRSWNDAQGFRFKDGSKITGVKLNAHIYHYGFVRPPRLMKKKVENSTWNKSLTDTTAKSEFSYSDEYLQVKKFNGTHPKCMQKRISEHNWEVDVDTKIKRHSFKDGILMWFENLTGHRLFENQHYYRYGKAKRITNIWDEPIF